MKSVLRPDLSAAHSGLYCKEPTVIPKQGYAIQQKPFFQSIFRAADGLFFHFEIMLIFFPKTTCRSSQDRKP